MLGSMVYLTVELKCQGMTNVSKLKEDYVTGD